MDEITCLCRDAWPVTGYRRTNRSASIGSQPQTFCAVDGLCFACDPGSGPPYLTSVGTSCPRWRFQSQYGGHSWKGSCHCHTQPRLCMCPRAMHQTLTDWISRLRTSCPLLRRDTPKHQYLFGTHSLSLLPRTSLSWSFRTGHGTHRRCNCLCRSFALGICNRPTNISFRCIRQRCSKWTWIGRWTLATLWGHLWPHSSTRQQWDC